MVCMWVVVVWSHLTSRLGRGDATPQSHIPLRPKPAIKLDHVGLIDDHDARFKQSVASSKPFHPHELGGGFVMRKNVGHDEIDPAENEASAARRQRLDVVIDKLIT